MFSKKTPSALTAIIVSTLFSALLVVGDRLSVVPVTEDRVYSVMAVVEILLVSISIMIASMSWSLRGRPGNSNYIIVTAAFIACSFLDLAHAMSYRGMPDFFGANSAARYEYFRVASRFVLAAALVLVAFVPRQQWSRQRWLSTLWGGFSVAVLLLWSGIAHIGWFEDVLLTTGAVPSVVTAISIGTAVVFFLVSWLASRDARFGGYSDAKCVVVAAALLGLSEFSRQMFTHDHAFYLLAWHLLRVAAYLLLLRAVYLVAVVYPYRDFVREHGRMHALLDSIPDAVFFKDEHSRFVDVNAAFCKISGYAKEDVIGRSDRELGAGDLATRFELMDQVVLREKTVVRAEELITKANGKAMLVEIFKAPLFDSFSNVIGVVGVGRDISGRRHSQMALQEREELLSLILDHASVAITLVDVETMAFAEVNSLACEMLGYSREELLSKTLPDVRCCESIFSIEDMVGGSIAGDVVSTNQCFSTGHGTCIDVEVSVRPINLRGHRMAVVIWKDVSIDLRNKRLLEESESRFRRLFQDSADAMLILEEGRLVDCNRAFLKLFGFLSVADVVGKTPADLSQQSQANGESSSEAAQRQVNLAYQGNGARFEWVSKKQNGDVFDSEITLTPITSGTKQIVHVAIRDIGEEKRNIEALKSSTEIHDAIFNQVGHGIVLTDAETLLFYEFNDYACHNLGYTREEFSRLHATDVQAEFDLANIKSKVQYIIDVGAHDFETVYRRKNGELRNMLIRTKAVRIRCRNYLVGVWHDITEKKQADKLQQDQYQRIKESESRLRSLFEYSPIAYLSLDEFGCFIDANNRVSELLGFSQSELIGRKFSDLCPEESRSNLSGVFACLVQDGALSSEIEVNRNDGSLLTLLLQGTVQRDEDGHFLRTHCVLHDISDRKRAEQAVAEQKDALEQAIEQRTAELKAAKEAAEVANRAKSAFLANMSHEIRTPMNAIVGLSHLLERNVENQRHKQNLHRITDAANTLLRIINDVLDYSKIEAGKMDIEKTDFDIESVFDNVISMVNNTAEKNGLNIDEWIDPAIPVALFGDPMRIGQVLTNFASNAVKFTSWGSVSLRAFLVPSDNQNIRVRFEVEDTGIGISEEDLSRLFKPFEQADSTTTRKYGGTGLGLAISRRLVELMGGETGATSKLGEGSVFWFEIPLDAGEKTRMLRRKIMDNSKALVVDDDQIAAEYLKSMLEQIGVEATIALSGERALDLIEEMDGRSPFSVVLLDWKMGDLSGQDVATKIQGMALQNTPPCLLVTAYGKEAMLLGLAGKVFAGIIQKPVAQSSLLDALVGLLSSENSDASRTIVPDNVKTICSACRFLLVEDNITNQEVAIEILHETGAKVDIAANGAEALQMIGAEEYDLVLMDMMMPVMDGLAATEAIRRLPAHKDLPIVAMTANAFQDDIDACLAAGMNDHVAKPVVPERLFSVLVRWLAPSQSTNYTPPRGEKRPGVVTTEDIPPIQPVSFAALEERYVGKPDFVLRLLNSILKTHANRSEDIRKAVRNGEMAAIALHAHAVKGSMGNICIDDMRRLAQATETAAKSNLPIAQSMASQLADAVDSLTAKTKERLGV